MTTAAGGAHPTGMHSCFVSHVKFVTTFIIIVLRLCIFLCSLVLRLRAHR